MSAQQMTLDGCAEFFAPSRWDTISSGARRLLGLLRTYTHGLRGQAFPFQRTLKDKLGVCEQTIRRWLRELVDAALVRVQRRGRTSAIYHLAQSLPDQNARSNARSKPSGPITEKNLEEEIPPRGSQTTPKAEPPPEPPADRLDLTWLDDDLKEYIGVYIAAGKGLTMKDVYKARAVWSGTDMETRRLAFDHILETCLHTEIEAFIPDPVNHLLARKWERPKNIKRVLPFIPRQSKGDRATEEAADMFARFSRGENPYA